MSNSMPEDQRTAYMRALVSAVVEHNVTFAVAEAFSNWYATRGRHTYPDDIPTAFEHWRSGPHYRPNEL
jgi:hypothetical protein